MLYEGDDDYDGIEIYEGRERRPTFVEQWVRGCALPALYFADVFDACAQAIKPSAPPRGVTRVVCDKTSMVVHVNFGGKNAA